MLHNCRLEPNDQWRRWLENCCEAHDAMDYIRAVLDTTPVEEQMLQASLSRGRRACTELRKSIEQAQYHIEEPVSLELLAGIQTALDDGYLGLAGAQADAALETVLQEWQQRSWEAIEPGHLHQLELRHQEATAECQGRLAEEVQRALEVGRCAVELSANMRRYDAESLELCLLKAEKLEMEGLEKVRSKLSTLRLKRNGRSSPENQKDGAEEAAPRRE
ncbi:unnamed protein product [Effrenium voratum]|nr:unnamed protein product [Effrenium voratum]